MFVSGVVKKGGGGGGEEREREGVEFVPPARASFLNPGMDRVKLTQFQSEISRRFWTYLFHRNLQEKNIDISIFRCLHFCVVTSASIRTKVEPDLIFFTVQITRST